MLRKKACYVLLAFLGSMMVLTLLSKGIYGALLPQVTVVLPKVSGLIHQIKLDGIIEQKNEKALRVVEGLVIQEIYAKEGSTVKKGTPLFLADIEDLEEMTDGLQTQIKKIDLQMQVLTENKKQEYTKQETELARASEELQNTEEASKLQEQIVEQNLQRARAERNALDSLENYIASILENDSQLKNYAYTIRVLEAEIKEMDEKISKEQASVSQNVIVKEELVKECNALKNTSETHRTALENTSKKAWEERRTVLEAEIKTGENNYAIEKNNTEKSLKQAKWKIEDAKEETNADPTMQLYEIDRKEKIKEFEKYKEIIENEGVIVAEEDCVISRVEVSLGERTIDKPICYIAQTNENYTFQVILTKEHLKYVAIGDTVFLEIYGQKQRKEGFLVENIQEIKEMPGNYSLRISVPASEYQIGQTGSLQIEKQTSPYQTCLPIEAIHSENNLEYVYVVRFRESFLGKEHYLEKRLVRIVARTERVVAIEEGIILGEEEILLTTTKEVKAGNVVRLLE